MEEFESHHPEEQVEPTIYPGNLSIEDDRVQSLLREKEAQILHLKDSIYNLQQSRLTQATSEH